MEGRRRKTRLKPSSPLSTSSSGVGPGYSTSSLYSSVKRLNLFPKRLADTDSGVIYNSNSFFTNFDL